MSVFEQYEVTGWKAKGAPDLSFPIKRLQESGGNRLVVRERPYRDGAKLDDTGSRPKGWSMTAIFENSIEEDGFESNGAPLYPDVLNALIASFEVHETGELFLPTRGRVKARAETYTRTECADDRDYCELELTFIEDNEDSVNAAAFAVPTVNASIRRLAETTTFDAQSDGAWDGSLQDLNEFASELEGLANAPGELVKDVDSQAGIVVGAANRAGDAFTDPSREGRDILSDPDSSSTQRKLERTKDIAHRARAQARGGLPKIVSMVFETHRTLFAIAGDLGQSADDLMKINPGIDPLTIPRGTPIKVFEQP